MKKSYLIAAALLLLFVAGMALFLAPQRGQVADRPDAASDAALAALPALPVPGMVTMIALGAKSCVPCKLMAPILEELEQEYRGRAAIVFIDLTLHADQAARYRVRAIPTQVFYDAKGVERFRHEGFMDKETIVRALQTLGVS